MTQLAQFESFAYGNVLFRGIWLRDVLLDAGVPDDYKNSDLKFVIFQGKFSLGLFRGAIENRYTFKYSKDSRIAP